LAHGHQQKPPLLHRALSPACIFVDRSGRARITDFAFGAALLLAASAYSRVLQSTCFYQSPEQVRARTLEGATDFFSLGAVLYESLTGKRAFDAPTPLAVSLKVSMGTFPALDAREVGQPMHDLVRSMLKVDPAQRPDGSKLASALAAMIGDEDTTRREVGARAAPLTESRAPAQSPAGSTPEKSTSRQIASFEDTTSPEQRRPVAPEPFAVPEPPRAPAPQPPPLSAGFQGPPAMAPAPVPRPAPQPVFAPIDSVEPPPTTAERTAVLQLPPGMEPGSDSLEMDPGEFPSFGDDELAAVPTQIGMNLPELEEDGRQARTTLKLDGPSEPMDLPVEPTQVLLAPPVAPPGRQRTGTVPIQPPGPIARPVPAPLPNPYDPPQRRPEGLPIVLLVAVSLGALALLAATVVLAIVLGS
jgi:hypothetical protein